MAYQYDTREFVRERLAKGYTIEVLAEKAGVTSRTIKSIENGQQPTPTTAGKLAKALGMELRPIVVESGS